jgi:hypothetical protein
MRGVHYLNRFFGGVGAEKQAGMSLEVRDDGAMGPGKLLEQLLGGGAPVIITLVCGDNYAVEHEEERIASVLEKVRAARADLCRRILLRSGPLWHGCMSPLRCRSIAAGYSRCYRDERGKPRCRSLSRALYMVDSGTNVADGGETAHRYAGGESQTRAVRVGDAAHVI